MQQFEQVQTVLSADLTAHLTAQVIKVLAALGQHRHRLFIGAAWWADPVGKTNRLWRVMWCKPRVVA